LPDDILFFGLNMNSIKSGMNKKNKGKQCGYNPADLEADLSEF
jgi:hypothetical protein